MVGRFERNKDTIQEVTESAATHVGAIAGIITGAVRDVTREIGELITDAIEMREAARAARDDDERAARDDDERAARDGEESGEGPATSDRRSAPPAE